MHIQYQIPQDQFHTQIKLLFNKLYNKLLVIPPMNSKIINHLSKWLSNKTKMEDFIEICPKNKWQQETLLFLQEYKVDSQQFRNIILHLLPIKTNSPKCHQNQNIIKDTNLQLMVMTKIQWLIKYHNNVSKMQRVSQKFLFKKKTFKIDTKNKNFKNLNILNLHNHLSLL